MAIPSEYTYISDINTDCYFAGLNFFGADGTGFHDFNESGTVWYLAGTYDTSLCSDSFTDCRTSGNDGALYITPYNIFTIRVNTQSYSDVRVSYTSSTGDLSRYPIFGELSLDGKYLCMFERSNTLIEQRFTGVHYHHTESFNSLSDAIDYIYLHWANITLIVDGETWIEAGLNVKTSNGGGATHIAKVTGQLKDLSSNLSDILLVSGGGGGGLLIGSTTYDGADAGGISGNGSNSGNQSTGYAFGQGESGTNVSGGGGGLYGGYKGNA